MKNILHKLFEHQYLEKEEASNVLKNIAQGIYNESQIASFLTVFLMRTISIEELCGFKDALLDMCLSVDLDDYDAIDIVGTGGDEKNTFNISTAACFVVAGAGFKVVKHGNYGSSSVSGASNVMEQHGVKFSSDINTIRKSIEECNVAYLHAPLFNPAMKVVAPIRRALAVRTFFNMLGPLVNPARPKHQLLGVYSLPLLRLYDYTYQSIDTNYTIVHSLDGYDEISLTDKFKVATSDKEKIYTPEMIGLPTCKEADIFGGNTKEEAALIFTNVLTNKATEAQKNVVIVNAAFAINTLDKSKTIEESIALAKESIESGNALKCFNKFVSCNQ
ncbi:MAG: anthranilate phosphoribosyltransferase [Rikenellaceae bacterium]